MATQRYANPRPLTIRSLRRRLARETDGATGRANAGRRLSRPVSIHRARECWEILPLLYWPKRPKDPSL